MGLSFYSTTLLGLVGLATGFAFTQRPKTLGARLPSLHSKLKRNYLFAYALAVGGDWLQGSHLFSLYHDEYQIPLKTIGYLFVAGFLAAGLSAPFLGPLADRYGRKRACIGFGIAYSLSCATKLFGPSLPLLGTGRILGGAATTAMLLFETWLVSEAKAGGMGSLELGEFLGRCTLVNGIVASCSGIASEALVGHYKTFKAPFVASAILLVGALLVIQSTWTENYGGDESTREGEGSLVKSFKVVRGSEFIPPRSSPADEVDPSLLVLAIAMTAFETSLYLFVFLWVPTLQESTSVSDSLPLGIIFSNFMVAFSLGSLVYNALLDHATKKGTLSVRGSPVIVLTRALGPEEQLPFIVSEGQGGRRELSRESEEELLGAVDALQIDVAAEELGATARTNLVDELPFSPFASPSILFHAKLCTAVMAFGAVSLGFSLLSSSPEHKFFSFILFELAAGLYYPILGSLRSSIFPESLRATLSTLSRLPMNLLVTLALMSGMEARRELAFSLCCVGLLGGGGAMWGVVVRRAKGGEVGLR